MNERIKELAVEARQYAFGQIENSQDPTEWSKCHNMFEEKFAQLIVKECATICKDTSEKQFSPLFNRESDGADVCYRKIKEHFGVEL